ncbi:CST complex subunit CTC [Trema orientale]|uniref:CST complex subunit CTC1 n=1 Tax=Trema orientale TaxID=63057 RepID=A0A2P5FN52_TREOI|nr:CST complex subunit CTC [Trema orientale]
MAEPTLLTIADLIQGARPVTAAHSLHPHLRSRTVSTESPHSDHTVITPLDYPAIVIGTVTLPSALDGSSPSNRSVQCSYNSCFQFSDGSASVCCDILDLDLSIIGKKICVLGWNFVPLKRGGGFLEIIRWRFSELESGPPRCSDGESYALASGSSHGCESSSKSRYRLNGALEFISPISVVPCSSGAGNLRKTDDFKPIPGSNLRGFLVQVMVCECRLCSSKESVTRLNDSVHEQTNSHSFTKPIIVYFCGQASSWHPVITKLIGNVVTISGLKKKLVYIGNEESCLMYVTAEKSYLRLSRSQKKSLPGIKTNVEGKGECGSYTGTVQGVYMQGMVVELDNEVWLLLTSRLLTPPHSLRVGALISVRNVHFVNPSFSWTKMVILGACYKTSIVVKCFSPLITGVLLLVSCFRKKFASILSEKEILGSKHKEGLVQTYATSHLPPSMLQSPVNRHGVFTSLCKYNSCSCEGHSSDLKLVVPIFTFVHHCDAAWIRAVQLKSDKTLHEGNLYSPLLFGARSYGQPIRKVFSSEDIGFVLIGSLKISPSSGRLQLVDATSSIDVIIPDLPSTWNPSNIYEVVDYILVIEGIPRVLDYSGLIDKPFSCRSIFNFIPLAREVSLAFYVQFHLRNAACRNLSFYPRTELGEDLERLESGTYHLLCVTHKFPVLSKFQGDTVTSDESSMFVEAVILHWNLFLGVKDVSVYETKDSGNQLKKRTEHCDDGNHEEHISKRCKHDNTSSMALSDSVDVSCKAVRSLRTCSNSSESSEKQSFCNFTAHQISCSATIRDVNNHRVVCSIILHYTGALNGCGFCRPNTQKVLLEFKPESFHIYQFLQIGCYYITKHDGEDSLCNFKDSDYVSNVKVIVTSKHHLWSLSFIPDDVLPASNLSSCPPLDDYCSIGDPVSSRDRNEVRLNVPNGGYLETSSDVSLSLPANMIGILDLNMRKLNGGMIKPAEIPEEIAEVYSCTGTVASAAPPFPNFNCLLPEGNLVSVQGLVVAAHKVDAHLDCQNLGDSLQSRFFSGVASTSCFHVLVKDQIVRIVGSLSKHAFPPGLGPGVDAIFHRVLELGAQKRWMLTPVSFIVINSIRVVNNSCSEKCSSLVPDVNGVASLDTLSSVLISKLVQHPDCKLTRFRCRVVAVSILVFENYRKGVHLQPEIHSRQYQVDIPIAGFVLDDGSSPCFCWANAERAASLLRLHEKLPKKAFESNDWTLKCVGTDNNMHRTIRYYLGRILENHDRITVKNFGSLFDSSYQHLAISVSSENALSDSDENFLRFVVFNACFGTFWTIAASLMDSDAVDQLEKENLLQTEVSINSMKHVWAKEVHFTNPFTEARNVIQELLDR